MDCCDYEEAANPGRDGSPNRPPNLAMRTPRRCVATMRTADVGADACTSHFRTNDQSVFTRKTRKSQTKKGYSVNHVLADKQLPNPELLFLCEPPKLNRNHLFCSCISLSTLIILRAYQSGFDTVWQLSAPECINRLLLVVYKVCLTTKFAYFAGTESI